MSEHDGLVRREVLRGKGSQLAGGDTLLEQTWSVADRFSAVMPQLPFNPAELILIGSLLLDDDTDRQFCAEQLIFLWA